MKFALTLFTLLFFSPAFAEYGAPSYADDVAEIRERLRQEKSDRDRLVREGRANVEYGEYTKPGVHGGYRGHWAGNNQDASFISSEYGAIYSTRGGWVHGFGPAAESAVRNPTATGRTTYDPYSRALRDLQREEKEDRDRLVRQGRANPEYGEYTKPGVYGGYRGHWAGNNQDMSFVSDEYGVVYNNKGGWVNGFGPAVDPAPGTKWGTGIDEDSQIYGDISDSNTLRRVSSLEDGKIYAVVPPRGSAYVTRAYRAGNQVVLKSSPLPAGTIVTGRQLGLTGADARNRFSFNPGQGGYSFDPID